MADTQVMQIEDKSTGKKYPVTTYMKEFVSEHIKELIDGYRVPGLVVDGVAKKIGFDHQMRLTLTPDAGLFQTCRGELALIRAVDTSWDYYLSESLNQVIAGNIGDLLSGKKIGPLLFEGILEFDLSFNQYGRLVLTKSE